MPDAYVINCRGAVRLKCTSSVHLPFFQFAFLIANNFIVFSPDVPILQLLFVQCLLATSSIELFVDVLGASSFVLSALLACNQKKKKELKKM